MSIENIYARTKVGIDWGNKGAVCIGVTPNDPENLITDGIYYATHPYHITTGTVTKRALGYKELSSAGSVAWDWSFDNNLAEFWLFRDSGTTRTLDVTAGNTYTANIYYKINAGVAGGQMNFDIMLWDGSAWNQETTSTASGILTGIRGHRVVQLQFSVVSGETKVALRLRKSNVITAASSLTIYGAMLVEDTLSNTSIFWNAHADDPYSMYDDISPYVLSFNHKLGKFNWDQAMPDEGTAEIKVNNESRIFSPEYSSSPLYEKILPRRRVLIFREDGSSDLIWSGWTEKYDITPGQFSSRDAKIHCIQGKLNLEKIVITPKIRETVTTGQAIHYALENGFEYPTSGATPIVGRSIVNGTYVPDPTTFLNNSTGGETLEFVGIYESDNEKAVDVIKDLIDLENNWFFINRYGTLSFFPADTITAASAGSSPNVTKLQEQVYTYSDEVWTAVRYTDTILQSFTPVSPANRFPLSDAVEVEIPANTGTILFTPLTYNSDDSPNDRSYGLHGDQTATAVRVSDPSTSVTIGGVGNSVVLGYVGGLFDSRSTTHLYSVAYSLLNTNAFPVRVTITTLGYGWRQTFNGSGVTVDGTNSLKFGYLERNLTNRFIHTLSQLTDWLTKKLKRYAVPYGWFTEVTTIPRDTQSSTIARDLQVGTIWEYSEEYQTAIEDKLMVVIGEQGEWTPNLYRYRITSSPKF